MSVYAKAVLGILAAVLLIILIPNSVSARIPPEIPPELTQEFKGAIRVNGRPVSALRPVTGADGTLMLPLRAIAEALGLTVDWNEAERRVDIGGVYSIWIDSSTISRSGNETTAELDPAPIIINSHTFVPISFFNNEMEGISAEVLDETVLIKSDMIYWRVTEIPDLQINLWAYRLDFGYRNERNLPDEYDTLYEVFEHEGGPSLAIWTDTVIQNFELIEVGLGTWGLGEGLLYFYPGQVLHSIPEFTPKRPFALSSHFGTMPRIAVTFLDENGLRRYFTITLSGVDGSVELSPFDLENNEPF